MINDILDLAKIEAGKVDLSIEPVTVAKVLENLKRRFEPVAAEKKLGLHFDVESGSPETIESDSLRLQQILTNLLSNALKFTETGSVRLRVAAMDGPRVSSPSRTRASAFLQKRADEGARTQGPVSRDRAKRQGGAREVRKGPGGRSGPHGHHDA